VLGAGPERDWDVLRLLALGQSDAEIAAALGISPALAGAHRTRLVDKLGKGGRARPGCGALDDLATCPVCGIALG
jgi:DNA-binding NarL/FixJ family response regulator